MSSLESAGFAFAEGGVVAARGFSCSGVHCGLKKDGRRDLAMIAAEGPVPAAAVFTTNRIAAAPVILSRQHIAGGAAQAVVINAGNANACTGEAGVHAAGLMASAVADRLSCAAKHVVVCSTGVIGVPLPVDVVVEGIAAASRELDSATGQDAAEAIMTTDTFPKQTAVTVNIDGRDIIVGGMAKGSGMIAPNMATMLAVITTDAPLTPAACKAILGETVETTFNRVTIDSDTSTNDTVVLLASGHAGGDAIDVDDSSLETVSRALRVVATELTRMIARDGEGATTLIEVTVTGAEDEAAAEQCARSIADSPLVKTAIFGRDANWGRIACAAGKAGVLLDPGKLEIRLAGLEVCRNGTAVPFDEDEAARLLEENEVLIEVGLGVGSASATVLTCDLTYEYVRINGEYRS